MTKFNKAKFLDVIEEKEKRWMSYEHLTDEACVPCRDGGTKANEEQIKEWSRELPEWNIEKVDGIDWLAKKYKFKNFKKALLFTVQVGELAEQQKHHPEIRTEWGGVTVIWWTHSVSGLHKNDFIMAAKTDSLFSANE